MRDVGFRRHVFCIEGPAAVAFSDAVQYNTDVSQKGGNYNGKQLQSKQSAAAEYAGVRYSLALCSAFGIFAVIFGAIGKSKAKKFIAEGGQLAGASKVGYILSKIAFVLGIISLVCYAIIITACIASPEFRNALLAEYGF